MQNARQMVILPAGDHFEELHANYKGELINNGKYGSFTVGNYRYTGEKIYAACKETFAGADKPIDDIDCFVYTKSRKPLIFEVLKVEGSDNVVSEIARPTSKKFINLVNENFSLSNMQLFAMVFIINFAAVLIFIFLHNCYKRKREKVYRKKPRLEN